MFDEDIPEMGGITQRKRRLWDFKCKAAADITNRGFIMKDDLLSTDVSSGKRSVKKLSAKVTPQSKVTPNSNSKSTPKQAEHLLPKKRGRPTKIDLELRNKVKKYKSGVFGAGGVLVSSDEEDYFQM